MNIITAIFLYNRSDVQQINSGFLRKKIDIIATY